MEIYSFFSSSSLAIISRMIQGANNCTPTRASMPPSTRAAAAPITRPRPFVEALIEHREARERHERKERFF